MFETISLVNRKWIIKYSTIEGKGPSGYRQTRSSIFQDSTILGIRLLMMNWRVDVRKNGNCNDRYSMFMETIRQDLPDFFETSSRRKGSKR